MASTLEDLRANIEAAIEPGFRHKLMARGQSRAMIWRDGVLPQGAPNFSLGLSEDLLSYGYSLLSHALRYAELGGEPALVRHGYEVAAEALEAVTAKGEHDSERDFHRLVAAAAYHLGRYSARAFSLLHQGLTSSNLSTMEMCLAKLMLRDLNGLEVDISTWFSSGIGSDESLIASLTGGLQAHQLEENEEDSSAPILGMMSTALDGNFMAALAIVTLALERGEQFLISLARQRLENGIYVAAELNLVAQWWCYRLATELVDGLWEMSFHKVLPSAGPPDADIGNWNLLRKLFIGSLYRRGKSEVELWPSQLRAAELTLDFGANLVLSLPTSAGKTRIAELCILACLAQKKRVVFITPLRALSAQTEVGLTRTFGPLGKTVSSLYGSIGTTGSDVDSLRSSDIVVATPEKLDFALRSDPDLLNDIGLVVLDEGHMIGLGEREVRYEAQIQRLLRRADAATRRIVCLSAILPDGEQLEDFAAWLTSDRLDGLIKNDWRPTRLRFGDVDWKGQHAQLNITVGSETPFVPNFFSGKKPSKGRATKTFPSDQAEMCIATAWRLIDDGQTVLVFCPLRKSVLPFAKKIIEMHKRGHIASVLTEPSATLQTALAVGAEWFGADHEILACLKLGVAIHHGALPTPYRKEVERLLRDGVLKMTISSPTLAQGLNLAATSLVFHGLARNGASIDIAEFRNVVGRAGRAYIDIEGLVLYPMFDDHAKRRTAWKALIANQSGREMESGLLRLVYTLLIRISKKLGAGMNVLLEYIAGQGAWEFPILQGEKPDVRVAEEAKWPNHLMSLDTAIFSLLGEAEIADSAIEAALDEILQSSLFYRRLSRKDESTRQALTGGLVARTKYIWRNTTAAQRRGYFLAGVGLATGKELDAHASQLEQLLLTANVAISTRMPELAVESIIEFSRIVFSIAPFAPKKIIASWPEILTAWLYGKPLTSVLGGDGDDVITFIEQAFVFNIPWAMEAVRVRYEAHVDVSSLDDSVMNLSDFPRGSAVMALEAGTMSMPAAVLIQAGFASRLGAIEAVTSTAATFDSPLGLSTWLDSDEVLAFSASPHWPTPESHKIWIDFTSLRTVKVQKEWKSATYHAGVSWFDAPMAPGTPLRIGGVSGKEKSVFTSDYREVGKLNWSPNPKAAGIFVATATGEAERLYFEYIGPSDFLNT
ncbi:DEAD/DEAH box helicase [Duganella sp. BuS-21]|uniref:DEAD/DEAH box helicase n=1 Tax=Duganella sp. BuS-21 TaxID=2943848 RepID=UPI0035A72390